MRNNLFVRVLSGVLSIILAVTLVPAELLAETAEVKTYEPTEQSVRISAKSDETVTVHEKKEEFQEAEGILRIEGGQFAIARDYEQKCMIKVTNTSGEAQEFYLEAENLYRDLSLEVIKAGARKNPALIGAGETIEVELSVFAQNAGLEKYEVPVTGYLLQEGKDIQDVKKIITLNCSLPAFDLVWRKVSEDESTLKQKFRITNKGDTLTDLEISASDAIANYVSFEPMISNYELQEGSSIEFTAYPDLAKMKEEGLSKLEGSLIASCAGEESKFNCIFDTRGREITVTTLGELALKQDGNPFTKFEVVEDSVSAEYFNGTRFVEVSNSTNLGDIFDENGMFQFRCQNDIDFGVESPVNFETELNSSPLKSDEEFSTEPLIEMKEGSVSITVKQIVKAEEYQKLLDDIMTQEKSGRSIEMYSAAEAVDTVISYTMKVNDFYSIFDLGSDTLGTMGNAYDIAKLVGERAIDDLTVYSNPMIPQRIKEYYKLLYVYKVMLTAANIIIGGFNPLAGFLFGFAADWCGNLFDEMQDKFIREAYSIYMANYLKILGQQCTNRGSIASSFYVPDYGTGSGQNPSMYTTSRLYADGYVDKEDTNYDVTLNGIQAKSVNIPGLTQTVMTEIPTEHLKPGAVNTLIFDYDTNPGSHSVNTDTRVTLLYPADTKIGYIGEPDTLQEVRTLPDFAVYPENIYTETELIAREKTKLGFHVYNIGSRGGWFHITAYEGEKEIFREENYYLSAFSSETFSVSWIPEAGNCEIRINIENTSVGLEELDSENNSAVKNLTVRQRQIPVIGELSYGEIYEDLPYSLVLDVADGADITDLAIQADDKEALCQIRESAVGNNKRYYIVGKEGLKKGEHKIKISIKYAIAYGKKTVTKEFSVPVSGKKVSVPCAVGYPSGTLLYGERFEFTVQKADNLTKTELILDHKKLMELQQDEAGTGCRSYGVSADKFGAGAHTVTIRMYYTGGEGESFIESCDTEIVVLPEEKSYFSFSLDKDIADPVFYVFDQEKSTEISCEELETGGYRFRKSLAMIENPEKYQLLIQSGSKLLVQGISDNHPLITGLGCHTVTIDKTGAAENTEITDIRIRKIGESPIDFILPVTDAVSLTPGKYSFSVNGHLDQEYFSRVVEVDLTEGNQNIALEDFVLSYYFKMEHTETTGWQARMYYKRKGSSQWSLENISTLYDAQTDILKCYTSNTAIAEQADEAVILVYSGNEVYTAPVNISEFEETRAMELRLEEQPAGYTTLDRNLLNKVSFLCETEGMQAISVSVQSEIFKVDLEGNALYLPDGQYHFRVVVTTGYQNMTVDFEDMVSQETELVVEKKLNQGFTDIKINWQGQFKETAYVSSSFPSGKEIYASDFPSGGILKTEMGKQTLQIYLEQEDCAYQIEKELDIGKEAVDVQIGSSFQGEIGNLPSQSCPAEGGLSFTLLNLQDENGNALSYFNGNSFRGNVTFTDTKDESRKIVLPAVAMSGSLVTSSLPLKPGTYHISVDLYSYVKEEEHQHSVVKDAGKEPSCTGNGMTEGSHCGECGQILVKQTVIPALGHQYQYIDNKDGTHTGICKRCKSAFTEKHKDICSLCGATGTKEPAHTHTWDKGKVVKKATVLATGEKVYTCTSCGAVRKEILPKLPLPQKGKVFTDQAGKARYRVVRSDAAKGTVEYLKPVLRTAKVTIPASVKIDGIVYKVTAVGPYAFKGNSKVRSITVGKNVTVIGKGAFQNCKLLTKVSTGSALKKMGSKVFYNCPRLTSVSFGKNLMAVPNSAFEKCKSLKSITIPYKVTAIGKRAFYGCGKLRRINIKSAKLKSVGGNAVKGINKKAVIKVPGSKFRKYKKLFTAKKGFRKTMKIKK